MTTEADQYTCAAQLCVIAWVCVYQKAATLTCQTAVRVKRPSCQTFWRMDNNTTDTSVICSIRLRHIILQVSEILVDVTGPTLQSAMAAAAASSEVPSDNV